MHVLVRINLMSALAPRIEDLVITTQIDIRSTWKRNLTPRRPLSLSIPNLRRVMRGLKGDGFHNSPRPGHLDI
jgi:hypothetical protein